MTTSSLRTKSSFEMAAAEVAAVRVTMPVLEMSELPGRASMRADAFWAGAGVDDDARRTLQAGEVRDRGAARRRTRRWASRQLCPARTRLRGWEEGGRTGRGHGAEQPGAQHGQQSSGAWRAVGGGEGAGATRRASASLGPASSASPPLHRAAPRLLARDSQGHFLSLHRRAQAAEPSDSPPLLLLALQPRPALAHRSLIVQLGQIEERLELQL